MPSRLAIRLGDIEVEFEGSEEFIREKLPELLSEAIRLHRKDERPDRRSSDDREDSTDSEGGTAPESPSASLANEIGVEEDQIRGSMDPSLESPHLRIDKYFWAALKKNTPKTGPNAIPPATLVATLMALWFDQAELDQVNLDQVRESLRVSDLRTDNVERSVNNCAWLQLRGNQVSINPAEVDQALKLARAFCTKKPIDN